MRAKNLVKRILLITAAALTALLLMNAVCLVYFNRPSHAPSDSGATDYCWQPDSAYYDMTEGFAFNRTNNEGYFNPYDYEPGMEIDVLIMGASQMQSACVQMDSSVPALLSRELGGATVYNLGMAGHLFETLVSNMDAALAYYRPRDCVVLEMETVEYTDACLESILDGTVPEMESYSGGIVNVLQKVDILRQLYSQVTAYMAAHPADTASADYVEEGQAAADGESRNEQLIRQVIAKVKSTADKYGVKCLILYDPKCFYSQDTGYLWFGMPQQAEVFAAICREEGVDFVDMCPRFQEEYAASSLVPYGFSNTSMGQGHPNKEGCRMIADELCKAIKAEELAARDET